MSSSTAELEARLELLEFAFFGDDEPEEPCDCDLCAGPLYDNGDSSPGSAVFTSVVLDGAEEAINRLTTIAASGGPKEALQASSLLLQYGLALVDRGRA